MRKGFCVLRQMSKTINTRTSIPKLNHSPDAKRSLRKSVNFFFFFFGGGGGGTIPRIPREVLTLSVFLYQSGFEQVNGYTMEKSG